MVAHDHRPGEHGAVLRRACRPVWLLPPTPIVIQAQRVQPLGMIAQERGQQTRKEEEHFVEEPVFDIDVTLVDAVEHITGGTPSNGPTRSIAVGSTNSRQRDSARRAAGATEPVKDLVPADQCERLIRDALEQVIRDLIQQLTIDASSRDASHGRDPADQGVTATSSLHVPESSLRDGIRKWLSEGDIYS